MSSLKTIKVFIDPEDQAIFDELRKKEGITYTFSYSQALKYYAQKIKAQKGGTNGN